MREYRRLAPGCRSFCLSPRSTTCRPKSAPNSRSRFFPAFFSFFFLVSRCVACLENEKNRPYRSCCSCLPLTCGSPLTPRSITISSSPLSRVVLRLRCFPLCARIPLIYLFDPRSQEQRHVLDLWGWAAVCLVHVLVLVYVVVHHRAQGALAVVLNAAPLGFWAAVWTLTVTSLQKERRERKERREERREKFQNRVFSSSDCRSGILIRFASHFFDCLLLIAFPPALVSNHPCFCLAFAW